MALLPKWSSPQVAPYVASVVAVIAHFPASSHRLLRDDVSSIRDNVDLRSLTGLWRVLGRAADLPDSDPGASPIVRPVHAAFEWLLWELARAQPAVQHSVSIALHALAAALLVRLLIARKVDMRIALASALMFAAHPATANAVATISSRALVLGGVVLSFGALRATEARTARALAGWTAFGVLASALAHEAYLFSAVPLVLLAPKPRIRAAAVGGVVATVAAFAFVRPALPAPIDPLRVAAGIVLHDLVVVLVPPQSSSFFTPPALPALLGIVVVLALAALVIRTARRTGARGAGAVASAGLSLVVLAPLALAPAALRGGTASDRSAWVVLLGLAIAGAATAEHLRGRVRAPSRIIAFAPFAVALAFVPLTWAHSVSFRDETTLLAALAADRPEDPEGKLAVALLASAKGNHPEAYPTCAEYASQRPLSTRAHLCVGTAMLAGGDPEGAVVFLAPYAEKHSDEERARRALAAALFATNDLARARAWVVRWRATHPKAPDVEGARVELVKRGAW